MSESQVETEDVTEATEGEDGDIETPLAVNTPGHPCIVQP